MTSLLLGLALSTPSTAVGQAPTYRPLPPMPVPTVRSVQSYRTGVYQSQTITAATFRRPQPLPPPVLTLEQFSRVFRPTPGFHKVWLVHPASGLPVEVCFTLPDGVLTDFDVNRRSIEFETRHGHHHHCVDIDFRHNGTVSVQSH